MVRSLDKNEPSKKKQEQHGPSVVDWKLKANRTQRPEAPSHSLDFTSHVSSELDPTKSWRPPCFPLEHGLPHYLTLAERMGQSDQTFNVPIKWSSRQAQKSRSSESENGGFSWLPAFVGSTRVSQSRDLDAPKGGRPFG